MVFYDDDNKRSYLPIHLFIFILTKSPESPLVLTFEYDRVVGESFAVHIIPQGQGRRDKVQEQQ